MDHAGDDDTPGDGFLADESAGTLHVSANDGEGV
ncbi:hypothetical protein SAMN05445871_1369 [Paraburkholderia caballeronis]|uniref:Uncharacterized protein n=2 Tax=Paraburkholderia caballeronis TaxID=416943 RepID=A0A1H7MRH4_9BURK|nr:hypothetical protein C7403_104324 [Paraburkholderia caballeronis]PXX01997.1 hypothetical protein C7407_104324 [Paraburkholderia caballeronis]RAK01154.1 hypothetical protein C7409_104324 [Paraburkholderia caballeronis]SEB94890.1 hypothetical protein SAMN05445871_1369 [Paraburkholderia caballeronis]SEL13946.1 hypothetical protein SAMN05192542_105145 [Paraburkholderia caballeronis]